MTTKLLERTNPVPNAPAPRAAGAESRPATPASPATLKVVVVRGVEQLERHRAAWEDLAAAACEANAFYEPWMLLPALKSFGKGHRIEFHLIFAPERGPETPSPLLYGFFPVERHRRVKGLPVKSAGLWKHIYCVLCTPLVRRGREVETLGALLDYYAATPSAPEVLEWNGVPGDRAFGQALVEVFRTRRPLTFVDESWNRSLIRTNAQGNGTEYINNALSGKRRKELKRQENRLRDLGDLQYIALDPGTGGDEYDKANIDVWVDQFLDLEARGWKGQDGGAFACSSKDRDYFRSIVTAAHRERKLMMLSLQLDGRPLALKCNFLTGNGAFAFKIAYDEEYARYSPGVLLEIDSILRLHQNPHLRWMDSGAIPDHFMINRLWTERRTLQNLVIATGRGRGELVVSLLPLVRYVNRLRRKINIPSHSKLRSLLP